jgi:hypothetical protein
MVHPVLGFMHARIQTWLPFTIKIFIKKMRKGVADLHRRVHVSQACNNRYLDALSTVETGEIVEKQLQPICQKTQYNGYEYRALNPWSDHDAALLKVICRENFQSMVFATGI